jgi:hypothetical protein
MNRRPGYSRRIAVALGSRPARNARAASRCWPAPMHQQSRSVLVSMRGNAASMMPLRLKSVTRQGLVGRRAAFTSSRPRACKRCANHSARLSEVTSQFSEISRRPSVMVVGIHIGVCPTRRRAAIDCAVLAGCSCLTRPVIASAYCSIANSAMRWAVASENLSCFCAARTASAKGPPPGTTTIGALAAAITLSQARRLGVVWRLPPSLTTQGGCAPGKALVLSGVSGCREPYRYRRTPMGIPRQPMDCAVGSARSRRRPQQRPVRCRASPP